MVKEAGIEPGATAPQGDMCDALTPVPPTPARWPSDGEVKKIWPSWLSKLPIPAVDYLSVQLPLGTKTQWKVISCPFESKAVLRMHTDTVLLFMIMHVD